MWRKFRKFTNMKKVFPWLVGAGIVFLMLSRKKQIAKTAQFSFDKLGLNLKQGGLNVVLGVLNPAQGQITINSVVGFLKVNGKDVASVQAFKPVTVLGNAKTALPLLLKPSSGGIISLIRDYIRARKAGDKTSVKITFVGNSNVDGLTLPISTVLL